MSCWFCHPSLLLRIVNSITLWWFPFKLSTTIRILAISFLLISTKSKWASHSNFLHLKKLNYPQHLLHITQTPFSKLNFLIGFSTAFLTNVNEHNFYISFKIAIAWFSRVLSLRRTVLLKPNFSWFQAQLLLLVLQIKIKPQDLKTTLTSMFLTMNSDNAIWEFWEWLTSVSTYTSLSHQSPVSSPYTHRTSSINPLFSFPSCCLIFSWIWPQVPQYPAQDSERCITILRQG